MGIRYRFGGYDLISRGGFGSSFLGDGLIFLGLVGGFAGWGATVVPLIWFCF